MSATSEHTGVEGGVPREYALGTDSEYRALSETSGVLDLSDRGVLVVEGPERLGFLHRLLSQEVKSLKAGQGARAALLDAKGHILVVLRLQVTERAVDLEAPRGSLALLESELQRYKVGTPVRFRREDRAILGVRGPEAVAVLGRAGAEVHALPREGHGRFTLGGQEVSIALTDDLPGGGFIIQATPEGAEVVRGDLLAHGAHEAGRRALDTLRIERGCPWFPEDIGTENLLHETGLVGVLHSSQKGCYIGQETVARLEARGGNVNKRLRGLQLDGSVCRGDVLVVNGEAAGGVTTSGVSPRFGPIALAYVRRPHMNAGTRVRAGSAEGEVRDLPFPEP